MNLVVCELFINFYKPFDVLAHYLNEPAFAQPSRPRDPLVYWFDTLCLDPWNYTFHIGLTTLDQES